MQRKIHPKRFIAAIIMSVIAAAGLLVCPACTANVMAATQTISEPTVWLRAKLEYKSDDGISDITDDNIEMASDKWKKQGDYFYYSDPVKSGDTIDLMKSVQISSTWTEKNANKKFSIVVTVEASECLPTDTGWNSNSEIAYSQSFETSLAGANKANLEVTKGNITVALKEYQLNAKTGKEEDYKNDKIITPGEKVSKIVRLTINGNKSVLTKKQNTITITNIWTGDTTNLLLLLGIGAACAGGAVIIVKVKNPRP